MEKFNGRLMSINAFASRIACGSFINWPMLPGVLLKRQANRFVRATVFVAVLPRNNTGAVDPERATLNPGTADAPAIPFLPAAGPTPDHHKYHPPASTSRPSKIQYVERERIKLVKV